MSNPINEQCENNVKSTIVDWYFTFNVAEVNLQCWRWYLFVRRKKDSSHKLWIDLSRPKQQARSDDHRPITVRETF